MGLMKKFFLLILSLTFFQLLTAQVSKKIETLDQFWIGYFNQTRLSNKWGFWLDAQIRTENNFVDSMATFVFRPGITYYLSDNTKLSLGYAFMNHYPADNHVDVSQPEQRIWQQLIWNTNYNRIKLVQRVRLEERFRRKFKDKDELAEGYYFNYRFRYSILFQFPLNQKTNEKGAISFVANDELMINFGKQVVYNYFDQNRFLLGFNYYFSPQNSILLGYMNQFQQLASGYSYKVMHVIRIAYSQNLDFRK
jgi:Protein of unknown function (DUF2490)